MEQLRNIAIIGAFLKVPAGALRKAGPNTLHASVIRFTDAAAVTDTGPTITAYLKEAMSYAEAGLKPPKEQRGLELPPELIDPELSNAFHALTRDASAAT